MSKLLTCILACLSFGASATVVNTSHLDKLYEQRSIDSGSIGVIHIYSEYPDYKWVKDPIEGVSAADDISRALVLYTKLYQQKNDDVIYKKIESLTNSLLYLHADNGYFYNFIYPDNTINETYKTSKPEANWWTWRSVWSLAKSYEVLKDTNKDLAKQVKATLDESVAVIVDKVAQSDDLGSEKGFTVPNWLPNSGADQSAVLLLGLAEYYKIEPNQDVAKLMKKLAKGIELMQIKDVESPIYGAMLSWKNIWHAYGNSQSYALMEAGMLLDDRDMVKAAFLEVDHFYPYLIKNGYLNWFSLEKSGDEIKFDEKDDFAQIAYGIRPMVFASLKAYDISRDPIYIDQAVQLGLWFFKHNKAKAQMYFPETGIAFDGIDSATNFNKNSGAESTIEALLALNAIMQHPVASKKFEEKLKEIK